jgi:hypothetical protein
MFFPRITLVGGKALFRFLKNYQKNASARPVPVALKPLEGDLCLARALLAAPSGPSAMCFLRHARGFGWLDQNFSTEAVE